MNRLPAVVLTRPLPESLQWQARLQQQGIAADVLPLIEIAGVNHPQALQALHAAMGQLRRYRALMFVSSNAVRFFLQAAGAMEALAAALQAGTTRLWAPGPGTRQALEEAGIDGRYIDSPAADAAQFDSEALWQQVAGQITAGDCVLIVRGASQSGSATTAVAQGSGREWLAAQLRSQGASVELVGVYQRQPPALTTALQQHIAAHCQACSLWLFSSSEAIAHLQQLSPQQVWHSQRALATHPRIAQAAQQAGFGTVHLCRPHLQDVRASIESLL